MRKFTLFVSIIVLLLAVNTAFGQDYSITTENLSDGSIKVTFDLLVNPQLENIEKSGQTFSYFVNLNEFMKSTEKGFPEYLSKQVPLMINQDGNFSLELVESDYTEFDLPYPYLVGRGTITRNDDPALIPYTIQRNAVTDAYFPENIIDMEDYFVIRNVRGFNFRFNITRINPVQAKAQVYTRLVFMVTPDEGSPVNALSTTGTQEVTSEFYGVMPQLFSNYDNTTRADWPYEVGEKGEILVIYTARDAGAIQPYITHKKNMGFTVTTREVEKGTNVKQIIREEYDSNNDILYVQLVGDWEDIKSDTLSDGAPIDTFLGAVSGSDNYIDLMIGRFSADNSHDVTVQVEKVITYETAQEQDWWKNGLGIGSGDGSGAGDDGEVDYAHMDVIKENKLLPNQYNSVAEIYETGTPAEVSAIVNSGTHVINYVGHGSDSAWVTTGFSSSDVNALENQDMLPVIFSVACVNGTFHKGTCFAESWLRKENGGAVGALMSTINQPWQPPMRGQDYMNDLLTGGYDYEENPGSGTSTDHGKTTFGSIVFNAFSLMYSESSTSSDLDTIKTWTLFGDASLRLVKEPETLTADFTYQDNSSDLLEYQFTDASSSITDPIVAWQWDFNGDASSDVQNPLYTFPGAGTFTVTLTVFDAAGKSKSASRDIVIEGVFYKESASQNFSYEWIQGVELGSFTNTSSGSNYTDYTATVIDIEKDKDHALTLTPGFNGSSNYTEYWKVWADLNRDGDFNDSGEELFAGYGNSAVTGTINLDQAVQTGETRLRIVMSYAKYGPSEGIYTYGETEDYTINIKEKKVLVYPASASENFTYEWIEMVQIGAFDNSSDGSAYTDFTASVITVQKNQDYSVKLTPGFSGSTYPEYWKVWADLNQDGDFDDAGEELFAGNGSGTVTGTIHIPSSTLTGETRLRIVMSYAQHGPSAGSYPYGETEDYTLKIVE